MTDSECRPRLCHLVKWPEFAGYGFNLHAERGKAGQFIGKVDEGSPSVAAGLKEADRIVEVNGVNIGNENHQQVVSRIKAGGEEVTLLVVDAETDNYFKENRQLVASNVDSVWRLSAVRDSEPRPTEIDSLPEPEEHEPEPEPPTESDYMNMPEDLQYPVQPPMEDEPVPELDEPAPEQEEEEEEQQQQQEEEEEEVEEVAPEPEPEPIEDIPEVEPVVIEHAPSPQFYPRLCHMLKWPDFVGYGFNLHAERERTGQFIGTVDEASPAEMAGLKEGDRIIEVNGTNIESETHQDVIRLVKAGGDQTQMLVVDRETDEYYKSRGIQVHRNMEEVHYKKSDRGEVIHDDKENDVPALNVSVVHEDDGSQARLCHITKWVHFQGYGFNLHADKESNGQYIGKIDDGSPAQNAELKEGDRIVEVNGFNVESESHQTVIGYIKEGGNETRLLVVDGAADRSFKSRGITVNASMSQLQYIKTEDRDAPVNGQAEQAEIVYPPRQMAPSPVADMNYTAPQSNYTAPQSNSTVPQSNGQAPTKPAQGYRMSAKEMRESLARKKKTDPKHNKMSFQSKLEAFQKM